MILGPSVLSGPSEGPWGPRRGEGLLDPTWTKPPSSLWLLGQPGQAEHSNGVSSGHEPSLPFALLSSAGLPSPSLSAPPLIQSWLKIPPGKF